jgi:hypothetical protein
MSGGQGRCLMALAILALPFLAGCGSGRPTPVRVTGRVTLNGRPVDAASVTLMPERGGRPASGTTDSAGGFTLSTFAVGDGALPGDYAVTVTKFALRAGAVVPATEVSGDGLMGAMPEIGNSMLPEIYGNPATSGLRISVTKGMPAVELVLSAVATPPANR